MTYSFDDFTPEELKEFEALKAGTEYVQPVTAGFNETPKVHITSCSSSLSGSSGLIETPEKVLDDVRKWWGRFVLPINDSDLGLLTLWAFHTFLCLETYTTPRLIIDSPIPGAGKTTVLEHLKRLCLNPVQTATLSSPALLARILDKSLRTILIDEVDRVLDPKNPDIKDLVAILNSGYKRGATRPVLVPSTGGKWDVAEMPTFSPVAMAGNAPDLPDDTKSRSIRILLLPDLEGLIEDSDWEMIEDEAMELGKRLAAAADAVRGMVRDSRPPLPEGTIGRMKEKWFPLKRVAVIAGARWSAIADELILNDIEEARLDREEGLTNVPPAITLLADIHTLWSDEIPFVASANLVKLLIKHNPQYWSSESHYGKDLTVQRMGRMLVKSFKVHSHRQTDGERQRGYYRSNLITAWLRMGMTRSFKPDEPDVSPLLMDLVPLNNSHPATAGTFVDDALLCDPYDWDIDDKDVPLGDCQPQVPLGQFEESDLFDDDLNYEG